MQYVQLDGTELHVSRLAFGTASLHHQFESKARQNLLHCAFNNGITHFDTAPYYGYGLAEVALGQFLRGRRDAVTVTTKIGLYPRAGMAYNSTDLLLRKIAGKVIHSLSKPFVDWNLAASERGLNSSLKRLATDYIDIMMLHEPDKNLINSEEYRRWLENQKSIGKIRYWGIAGEMHRVKPWVSVSDPLAKVVQTRDNVNGEFSKIWLCTDKPPQITYGYLSSSHRFELQLSATEVMELALKRNLKGAILFSSGKCSNIKTMAELLL